MSGVRHDDSATFDPAVNVLTQHFFNHDLSMLKAKKK